MYIHLTLEINLHFKKTASFIQHTKYSTYGCLHYVMHEHIYQSWRACNIGLVDQYIHNIT
jgi:hypothetical protein